MRTGRKELKMRREEMNRERELKVVLDRERLDQVVRNARAHAMSRAAKNEEWAQLKNKSLLHLVITIRPE